MLRHSGFLLVSLTVPAFSADAAGSPLFRELVVDAGFKVDHAPVFASLEGDRNIHMIVAGQDLGFTQHILIFRIDTSGEPQAVQIASLFPQDALIAYDVARLGDSDSLVFIEPGRVLRYDPGDATLTEILGISSFYRQERHGPIAPLDFFRDLNQDGRDDLVVPDLQGYRIRLQQSDGSLGDETLLEDSVVMGLNGGNVRFDGRGLFSGDMNFDHLVDLGYWSGDDIGVYFQAPGLRYREVAETRPSGLGVLTEEEQRMLDEGIGALDQEGFTERDIESIKELNGDGIPDIIAEATYADGVFDRRNEFSLHLGRRNGDSVEYLSEEDALIAFKGLQFDLIDTDIDGDGKQDLVVRKARLSFGRVIRALISGSVPVEIHFHRMADDDTYPDDANFVAKTKVRFSRSSGQVDIPAIAVDDFDGDGLQDLIIQTARDRLAYYGGRPTDRLFADEPVEVELDLPRNGELVYARDVDDDGRADLVLRYNEADAEGMMNTVRLMLSSPRE